jgi:hypothetical protein
MAKVNIDAYFRISFPQPFSQVSKTVRNSPSEAGYGGRHSGAVR